MRKFLSIVTLVGACSLSLSAFAAETTEVATEATAEVIPEATTPLPDPVTPKVRPDYIVNTDEENYTHTYYYYVVSHSGNSYWATTQDGNNNLWFHAHENKGEYLQENNNFKATFDREGRLLAIEKYSYE